MTIYINVDTGEYPRYEADLLLDPQATWAQVTETNTPAIQEDEMAYQITPILIDNKYVQQWETRKLTDDELKTIKP